MKIFFRISIMKYLKKILFYLNECLFKSLYSNLSAVFIVPKKNCSEGVTCQGLSGCDVTLLDILQCKVSSTLCNIQEFLYFLKLKHILLKQIMRKLHRSVSIIGEITLLHYAVNRRCSSIFHS